MAQEMFCWSDLDPDCGARFTLVYSVEFDQETLVVKNYKCLPCGEEKWARETLSRVSSRPRRGSKLKVWIWKD